MSGINKLASNNNGFSLIELMVVLVILAIGMLPLALVQSRAQQDVFEAGQFSEAVAIAQLQMEATKSQGFVNAVPDSGTVGGTFNWNVQVQNVSFGLNQLTVNVNWSEKGRPRNVQVIDMVSFR